MATCLKARHAKAEKLGLGTDRFPTYDTTKPKYTVYGDLLLKLLTKFVPGHGVFYNPKNMVMWPNGPSFLVGGIGHIQLSIFFVIGMECKA